MSGKTSKTKVELIPMEKLVVSEANVRKHGIDPKRLTPSIEKEGGIIEPIHVWYNLEKDVYEIMQGQHRYLGAKGAGISELECIVHLDIKTLEDAKKWCRKQACLQEDLDPLDKLQLALDLKEGYGSLRKGCEHEGLSYSKLSDWYSLRKLSTEVIKAISTEISDSPKLDLPLRKLKQIARLPKEKQFQIAKEIEGLNDAETRRVLKEVKGEADSMPVLIELNAKTYDILRERAERKNLHLEHYCSRILEEFVQND